MNDINQLKHFDALDYKGEYFTEVVVFEKGGFVGNLGLSKKLWKKYIEASYKYRTNTDKMTASDYTHLFGYLNPYYRTAYSIPKRKR